MLHARAENVLVEGVNSPSRGANFYKPYPVYIDHGKGGRIYDVDGNEYVDLMLGFSVLVLGHAHPEIARALSRAADYGTHYAAASQKEVEVAERLCQLIPCADKVRFTNSGTEATMAAIRLARGLTGKSKFIKFEGQYHGWHDDFLVNCHPHPIEALGTPTDPVYIKDSSGLNPNASDHTIVIPWNDAQILEDKVKQYKGQIAAIITEPIVANIGCILPKPGYLEDIRRIATENDIILIFDEVVTGIRYAPGGCQEYYGVTPDIATFGKALGAGVPIGMVAGRADIMDAYAWGRVLHYGTFNGLRLAMEMVDANLDVITQNDCAAIKHLSEIGDQIIAGMTEIFGRAGTPAIVQGFGPMFQVYFTGRESIDSYRDYCEFVDTDAYATFANKLRELGVYVPVTNGLHAITCVAHAKEDVDRVLNAAEAAIKSLS